MTNPVQRNPESSPLLQPWREELLLLVLRGAAVLGLFAIVVNLLTGEINIFLPIYIAMYAGVLLLLFFRLPYYYRAGLLILLTYGFGLRGLLTTGIWGESRVFFIAFVVLTGFLFSPRIAVGASGIVVISSTIIGWLILT